jgi:hypothetical protein
MEKRSSWGECVENHRGREEVGERGLLRKSIIGFQKWGERDGICHVGERMRPRRFQRVQKK